ncbi:MAG: hypothetical protein U0470_09740 [Anaerolineae bacterium]
MERWSGSWRWWRRRPTGSRAIPTASAAKASLSAPDDAAADPYAIDPNSLGGEVNPELLSRLVCPLDKGPLDYVDGKWLVNRRNGYRYPITDGIPVMLIEVGERYRDPSMITAEVAPADGAAAS